MRSLPAFFVVRSQCGRAALFCKTRKVVRFCGANAKNFSGDFLAEIVQNTYFDTRLAALEGKFGVPCLAAFFICAGSAFVNLFNQADRLSVLGDFGSQPRVKVVFLSNYTQYFCRKIDFTLCLSGEKATRSALPPR